MKYARSCLSQIIHSYLLLKFSLLSGGCRSYYKLDFSAPLYNHHLPPPQPPEPSTSLSRALSLKTRLSSRIKYPSFSTRNHKFTMQQQTRTVQVTQLSDLATEREIHEFFSFSGEIESIQIQRDPGLSKTAFVTFKDSKALEIALLLSGATLVDQIVTISAVENYVVKSQMQEVRMLESVNYGAPENASLNSEEKTGSSTNGRVYVNRAQDVVTSMLQKGSAIGQDAVSKAKAFDEKHRLTASASEKVISFDKRVRLTEKLTVGLSVVNEKVKSVDQRLQVSDKTMAAIFAAEKKLNDTGSAVKTSRYVTVGAAWLNGAFGKVAKAGQAAGSKTREKFHLAVSNLAAKSGNVSLRYEGEIQPHGVQDDFLGAVIGSPKRNLQLSHKPKVWVAESNVNAHSFMNTFNIHVAQVVNLRTGVL